MYSIVDSETLNAAIRLFMQTVRIFVVRDSHSDCRRVKDRTDGRADDGDGGGTESIIL